MKQWILCTCLFSTVW